MRGDSEISEPVDVSTEHPTVVTVSRDLRAARPLAPDEWEAMLAHLVQDVARVADSRGAKLIGHVKALATLPEGHIRASAVDVIHPPTTERRGDAPSAAADLVLTVLVYGLPATAVSELTEAAVSRSTHHHRLERPAGRRER